uniref:CSON012922 protein n=1 Tax=Culicoides sonorensis TaxID=179676 RepID=A0A336LG53_CULSO
AFQIANLIREYMEVIQLRLEEQQKQLMNDPMTQSNRAAATAALQQHNAKGIMLTSLQSQLELGDCGDTPADYRLVASHCLPPRFVPNIPHDGVAMHHQSLRGMTQAEAKKSFLNLIQSWPLHKSTIFDVMQSFTSNWPRVLWLAVDQKGLHLLEHRSRNTLCTYDYGSILSFSPNMNCLMIITGSDKKQSKVILTTSQMSKWEKYRTAAAQAVQQNQNSTSNLQASCRRQHHLFLFKKHLFCDQFMNLEDPVEKELLYHQVLHGLRTERFPISEMEA